MTSSDVAMETESSAEPKLVGSKEMRTVFVSNLSMSITEEQLREKFAEVCDVFVMYNIIHYFTEPLLWVIRLIHTPIFRSVIIIYLTLFYYGEANLLSNCTS